MAQVTSGLRAVFNRPQVYNWFQNILGAAQLRQEIIDRYVQPKSGDRVLDIGCGPGDLLALLPSIQYTGMDLSPNYISAARSAYGRRGEYIVGDAAKLEVLAGQKFDIIISGFGLLHHLDDRAAQNMLRFSKSVLAQTGRVVTLDPCFTGQQSVLARWLISGDRGQNVRTEGKYRELGRAHFSQVECYLRGDLLRVPYTHCALVCAH